MQQNSFYSRGGVNVDNVDIDAKAVCLHVDIDDHELPLLRIQQGNLLFGVPTECQVALASFIHILFLVYRKLNFVYMEINPIVYTVDNMIIPLYFLAAKIDETASFISATNWGHLDSLKHFGQKEFPKEVYIWESDAKTSASLKLTILNLAGCIWTMVAGGGASVVYADTISDLGHGHELANYGEYSGAISTEHTFTYAKMLIRLMTKTEDLQGRGSLKKGVLPHI